ncbi:gliding motility-associated C-terminal domain-containing protein [Flavobacterium silvaticum]|uniref:T9SS type B sorting domain-containing protein n=1 Tax=Flavobacterium silvaticum TaxID=1852020 RepID=A0A972FZY9_9FLAO|nr:gliding motility-associated C-terminal domain-containing protein [Flavobacterium silvaticum]NMH27891.1 T9SS type B sorting domain-containing protein [Flavobacterium silvaticum]
MRKITLSRKTVLYFWLCFMAGTFVAFSQCPTVTQPNQSFCDSQSPTVSSLQANANGSPTVSWFATAVSTTPLNPSSGLVNGNTYWVSNAAGTCPRQSVTVSIYGPPTGPVVQGVCADTPADATVSDLQATGNNVQWYDAPSGGNLLNPTDLLVNGATYYATQTNPITGCQTSPLTVVASIFITPIPTGNPSQQFCNDPADIPVVGDLQPSGSGYRWYATSSSSVPLPVNTPLIDGESYYAASVNGPCQSTGRLEVFVDLVVPNDAGNDGTLNVCINELASESPANLFSYLGGSPDTTGTWTGPFPTSNGNLGSVDLTAMTIAGSPYVFTYTVTSTLCPPDTSTVSVTVLPLPVVTIASNQTICSGEGATVTFTGTPNAVVTYNINGGSNQTITLNASGTASVTNTYNATTTFNLVSVSTTGVDSCTAVASGSVVITVIQLPTATIASSQTICQGQQATITFTGTPNATVVYNTGGANQSIVLDASGNASITATFNTTTTYTLVSATTSGTPACSRALAGSVTITVTPTPVATIAADVTVCTNGSATITFTGTPNAIVTYTINGGGNQTIALNASGTATITQNYSVTTVYTLVSVTVGTTPSCIAPISGTATVTVLPIPTATIASDQTICVGQSATVTLTGTPNATVTYTVNGGSNQTVTLDASGVGTITGTYSATTTITLVSIVTAGTPTCFNPLTGSVVITIATPPTATIASSQNICSGESATVTFTGTPGATVNYTSNGSSASIVLDASGTATLTQVYTATTTYVLVSVTSVGPPSCNQPLSGQIVITVTPAPVVTIASSQTICSGEQATVTFTGTPGAIVTYNIGSGPNQTITLNASGTASFTNAYTVTTTINLISVTAPGNICTIPVTGSVVITVIDLPTASFSASQTICQNESATINFTGTPNATVTFTATPGGTQAITLDASGNASLTQTYTATTTYTLVSASISGCTQNLTGTVVISILTPPVADIEASQTVCPNTSVTLTITATPNSTVTYTINGGTPLSINIGASGTTTISLLVTETTVVALTEVSNTDCTVPLTDSVTITVLPLPVASISSDQIICTGDSATVNFTGTPGAIVAYTVNGTSFTITLDASGNASVTGNYTVETIFQLVSATLSGTPACSQPITGTVTISIAEPPFVTIAADTTICSGDVAIVAFNGTPGATVNYTVNGSAESLVLNASGFASLSNTYTVTTIIALVSVTSAGSPGCTENVTAEVTITVIPPAVATIASDVTICSGDDATITFTGTPNAIVTYTINGGGNQTITLNASGTATITDNYTVTTVFTLVSVSNPTAPACPQPLTQTATVTVFELPTASMSISGPSNICEGQTATVTFTGTPDASVTYMMVPGTSGTVSLDASGIGTISLVLTANTVITLVSVSTTGGATCTQNIGTSLSFNVTPAPNAGNDVASFEICSAATSQDLFLLLGADAQTGGTWLPALASGTGVFNPAVDAAGTYVYTVPGNSVCEPDTASVTVTIVPAANAGNDAAANICSNQDPIDLFALLGTDAQTGGTWSPALASGTGIFNPAVDAAANYTYTVLGTAPCPNDSAVVSVTITPGPDAGQDGTLTICVNSPSQDLFDSLTGTPQVGGTWSPALASGTGVFNPAVDAAGVYTYTFAGTNPCDNDTATVTVTVNPVPDAGEDGSTLFCTNYDPADLITFLGGTPQAGGTWSPALASGTGVFNPMVDAAGVYTYTVGGGFCDTSIATVTVTVVAAPVAGADGTLNTCLTTTSLDLTTGLDGTQGSGTFADTDGTGALSGTIFNPSAVGVGTYHFTYTVGGGVSPCLFDTSVVTVIVEPQPNAGTFAGIQSVCISEGTFDLSILIGGNQTGGTWTTTGGTPVANPLVLNTFTQGTYTFNYTVTNSCGSDAEPVQLNINANPVLTNANITVSTPVCAGSGVTVNLSGLADGSYNITYDLTGTNLATGLSQPVTISSGAGSFVIPSGSILNLGLTNIIFTQIANTATNCSSQLTNVSVSFTVVPSPEFTGATATATSVCLGNAVVVSISGATAIVDGTYSFGYDIPGLTPSAGSSGPIAVAGGSATFTIPASAFTSAGTYTITLNSINNGAGCTNTSGSILANFEIFPIPDLTGAQLTAADVCFGTDGEIIISNATALVDGSYIITYQLSGASIASGTATVDFTGGDGSFAIPASDLPALGQVGIVIQDIVSDGGSCGPGSTISLSGSFEVSEAQTPVLSENGDEFCFTDNPTVADLSANIQGSGTVIFYNAPTGGTAYSNSDILVQDTTYYAVLNNGSGCESPVRLAVTVDLTHCDELLIPDGFSPNGDGINDEFVILNIGTLYPNYKLEIYNRYGNILYKGNNNTPNWNGTTTQGGLKVGDGVVPVGVYFYILEFNDGTRKPQQGRLYLSR